MVSDKPHDVTRLMTEASSSLIQAWSQPWHMLNIWNAYWGDQWSRWLTGIAAAPAAWLPALAEERKGQPAPIDFFLPWIPRADADAPKEAEIGENNAVKVMMRASVPHVGAVSPKPRRRRKSPAS